MACCGRKKRSIGAIEMAKNLVFSVSNALMEATKTGKLVASKETIQLRMDTCKECNDFDGKRCLACGCYIILKTGLVAEKCPKGYWE